MSTPDPRELLNAIRQLGGTATSPQLQARLGISQPSASRLLAPLLADGTVVAVGSARARRYLLPREVPGVGRQVPIHAVQPGGAVQFFGTLYPLAGDGFWMEEADREHGQSAEHRDQAAQHVKLLAPGFLGLGPMRKEVDADHDGSNLRKASPQATISEEESASRLLGRTRSDSTILAKGLAIKVLT